MTWLLAALTFVTGLVIGLAVSRLRGRSAAGDAAAGPSKIQRIKEYRLRYGVGLKDAKEAVEAQQLGQPVIPARARPADASLNVEALLAQGNAIGAIKLYREQTGVGLKEAKDAIDKLRAQRGRDGER